jgi:hypothetical protein
LLDERRRAKHSCSLNFFQRSLGSKHARVQGRSASIAVPTCVRS